MKDDHAKEEYERCIICGDVTDVPISTPIDMRENYEVGVGQICCKCAEKRELSDCIIRDE